MIRPLIGISSSINESQDGIHLDKTYVNAVAKAGGIPVVIPLSDTSTYIEAVKRMDGMVFSGGEDINPIFYGERPHKKLGRTTSWRDRLEIEAMKYAYENNIPTLGICRGMQLMNISFGGTLYQDIPSELYNKMQHYQKGLMFGEESHPIKIEENSLLRRVIGVERILVNSFHHQAVNKLATSFKTVAKSPDFIVEAIEDSNKDFFIGVQWHPEESEREEIHNLFKYLILASTQQNQKVIVVSA